MSGPKFEFFWLGLRLGCIMVCEITLICVQIRSVILIRELAEGPDRNRSPICTPEKVCAAVTIIKMAMLQLVSGNSGKLRNSLHGIPGVTER